MNFVHKTYSQYTPNQLEHTYKGSLLRHIAVEEVANNLAHWFTDPVFNILHKRFLWSVLRIPFVIVWGLNCNFPTTDVMLFVIYRWLKKGEHTS